MNNEAMLVELRGMGISDERVLKAMSEIDRQDFVSPALKARAYENNPLPIEESQTISQPYIVALMTEALHLRPTDRVLEIGTGSGYQAAILSRLCKAVYTMEVFNVLHETAKARFESLSLNNITAVLGSGYEGLEAHTPYDAIILTAAPEKIPDVLLNQLIEGGRLLAPIGRPHENQELVLMTRRGNDFKESHLGGVRFVPMI